MSADTESRERARPMSKAVYKQLLQEDLVWLRNQKHSLERNHIESLLVWEIENCGVYAASETERLRARVLTIIEEIELEYCTACGGTREHVDNCPVGRIRMALDRDAKGLNNGKN